MRPINEIVVHATATPADWRDGDSTTAKVAEVKRWHTAPKPTGRGWSDIGYHFLIDRDGTVVAGRPVDRIGAHVAGHNTGTIGVSLFGGHGSASTDRFSDHFTPAQDKALRALLADLSARYGATKITGHNQYAAKACPGFNVATWLAQAPLPTGGSTVAAALESIRDKAAAELDLDPADSQRIRWRLAEIRDLAAKALA